MTPKEEEHLADIKIKVLTLINDKFRRGAEEHSADGPLIDQTFEQILDFAIDEAVDQLTYLLTLKGKVGQVGQDFVTKSFLDRFQK